MEGLDILAGLLPTVGGLVGTAVGGPAGGAIGSALGGLGSTAISAATSQQASTTPRTQSPIQQAPAPTREPLRQASISAPQPQVNTTPPSGDSGESLYRPESTPSSRENTIDDMRRQELLAALMRGQQ